MMVDVFQLILFYFVYYLGIPASIGLVIWKIKQKRDFIKVINEYRDVEEDNFSLNLQEENKKLKILQITLVIFILISIPALNLTFYRLQDLSMHSTRLYTSGATVYPAHFDLVKEQIGPTFDKEDAIEQMKEAQYIDWYLDDIRDQIDIEELIHSPGEVTFYKFKSAPGHPERVVITHSYLLPIPITRSIHFIVLKGKAFLEGDKIVAYPMPPSLTAPS